ncbi:MAG: arsenic resistance N-acetyltransferase ArsN2, partial [Steroidobacteraceae bacterium]
MTNFAQSIAVGPAPASARGLLAAANLPSSDLTDEQLTKFFYCGPAAAPSALIGLEIYGADALLRSLVVDPSVRSAGLGSALVAHVETHAAKHDVGTLYLLTTTAEAFFARRGYGRIDRSAAPAAIRSTKEFAGLCPA